MNSYSHVQAQGDELRTAINLQSNNPCTTSYGIDTVSYVAPKI